MVSNPHVIYIDLLSILQEKALSNSVLYPRNYNGHPLHEGYKIIGTTIAHHIGPLLPDPPNGLGVWESELTGKTVLYFVNNRRFWGISSRKLALAAGWVPNKQYPKFSARDIAGYENMGNITMNDLEQLTER